MSKLIELKFDEMEIDTTLAKEYFKKKNYQFNSVTNGNVCSSDDINGFDKDPWNNKVYYSSIKAPALKEKDSLQVAADSLWQLSKKIEENGDLFCQLEHLANNYCMDDCKSCLKILANICRYWGSIFDKYTLQNRENHNSKLFYGDGRLRTASLLDLAQAIHSMSYQSNVIICPTPKAAAISTLFMELCAQVGLGDRIHLHFQKKNESESAGVSQQTSCIGIVTETTDVDSAVHTFLAATVNAPWKLSRILVQESIYEDFKKALQRKCKVNNDNNTSKYDQNINNYCTDVQVGGGKVFLFDYVGGEDVSSNAIAVEAYRTTKELVAIVSKHPVKYVSLWASEAAQANEIAVALPIPMVWINSYGVFDGPPQVAETAVIGEFNFPEKYDNLDNVSAAWVKLDVKERKERMIGALNLNVSNKRRILPTLIRSSSPGFVEVNKNDMWIGIDIPVGFVYVNTSDDSEFFVNAAASIVHGNRVVLSPAFEGYSSLVKALENAGVPIYLTSEPHLSASRYQLYKCKLIYSHFGTIFAN